MMERFRAFWTKLLSPVARLFLRLGISPDAVTVVGTLGVCAGSLIFFPQGEFFIGVLICTAFVFSDIVDGHMARLSGRSSSFGAFLDSTLDRLAEGVIFGAIGITFADDGLDWALAACFVALTASFLVSYARARAEGLGIPGSSGGLMGRPERLVIIGAGLFLGALGDVLPVLMVILAALSLMTAAHRIALVYNGSDGRGA
jgi:CDP-diacylglycerol---glycerol-3-phosphate 3-phosphatidyltransferase